MDIRLVEPDEVGGDSPLRGAGQWIAFAVQDTGIGIPTDKLSVIFEAFQQADGTTNRRYGGTGLGLTISRELTRMLGGELHVSSAPGAGSTFTLYLPLRLDADAVDERPDGEPVLEAAPGSVVGEDAPVDVADMAEVTCGEAPQFHGEKVLVVDDDPRNVFAVATLLERHGLQVVHAENGVAGEEALGRDKDIALVLLDIMLPGLDGHATTAEIRKKPEYADLPIIAVTAKAMKGDREKSLAAGATDYVTKPVDTEHLLRLIAAHLRTPSGRH
jgi:CheY-like chemotaxis protein